MPLREPLLHGEIAHVCRRFSRGVTDESRTALLADGTTGRADVRLQLFWRRTHSRVYDEFLKLPDAQPQ